jgi:hypothetical protein
MEENDVKDPRCLVCGGATPYKSMPMPQALAMATLNSQDPTGSVADVALNLLSKRITTNSDVGEEHTILLRSLYECFQGGLSCFPK